MKVAVATASRNATAAIGLLVDAQSDFILAGEATDLTELLVLVKTSRPDAIVLDWDAFGNRIVELQQLLELFDVPPEIVALSVNDQLRDMVFDAGVKHFAHKGSPPEKLLEAIRQAEPSNNSQDRQRSQPVEGS